MTRLWQSVFLLSYCVCVNVAYRIDGWHSLTGRLRLVNGDSNLDGVVEALIDDEWGMVCGQNWTLDSGHAVCQQLGYIGGAESVRSLPTPHTTVLTDPLLINVVPCNADDGDGEFVDCEDGGSSGDDWCNLGQVAWVKCSPLVPIYGDNEDFLLKPQALQLNTEPTAKVQPIASDIGGGSVTLDWTDWYDEIKADDLFIVSFVIKYRLTDNEAAADYSHSKGVPSYTTRHTVTGLKERSKYEFIIEVVMLGASGGEQVGPVTQPFLVNMPCGAPPQVVHPELHPKNGTGEAVEVTWTKPSDPDCPASSYTVSYELNRVGKCDELYLARLNPTHVAPPAVYTTATHFTLEDLQPYSTYNVYVKSRNEHGESPRWKGIVTTNEGVPTAEPTGIVSTFFNGTKTGLRFSWDPIPCNHQNGIIIGYSYILLDVTTDEVTKSGEIVSPRLELMISPEVRQYKLLVAAKTRLGRGPYAAYSVNVKPKITKICGRTIDMHPSSSQRIVRGDTASKGSAPWLAQVWSIEKGALFCHGSILDDRWILTAAHCIRKTNISKHNIRINLGDFDKHLPEEEEQAYAVEEIIVHSRFDNDLFDADIALIKVVRPIQFTDYIRPICLPQKKISKRMLSVSRLGVVSGWGKLAPHDEEYPRYLKKVILPVRDQTTCKRSTDYEVTPNMFCAGYSQADRGDACKGDSGAPFAIKHTDDKWYVIGIVSWGEGCDQADKFGFFVRLHRYTAWIKKQTGLELR